MPFPSRSCSSTGSTMEPRRRGNTTLAHCPINTLFFPYTPSLQGTMLPGLGTGMIVADQGSLSGIKDMAADFVENISSSNSADSNGLAATQFSFFNTVSKTVFPLALISSKSNTKQVGKTSAFQWLVGRWYDHCYALWMAFWYLFPFCREFCQSSCFITFLTKDCVWSGWFLKSLLFPQYKTKPVHFRSRGTY